ncbi:hypothetical protein [Larkinella sp.]|uniref:hypothetical protein n=1 Tax=Larkinella sp. TaxID=2034517 RepID=UPI003BAD84C5
MKLQLLTLVLGVGFSASAVAQQTTPNQAKEDTQRRLRRTETRTTTTKLYPERDSILVLLKSRMAVLNPGLGTAGNVATWFTEEAKITDSDGSRKTPAEYQASGGKIKYQHYRVRKLEINENTAQSVEVYSYVPAETTGAASRSASVTSQLRKDPDGRWRITDMRITSK